VPRALRARTPEGIPAVEGRIGRTGMETERPYKAVSGHMGDTALVAVDGQRQNGARTIVNDAQSHGS